LSLPAGPSITLSVADGWRLPEPLLERAVRIAIHREGVTQGEFSITFLPDADALELNRRWLGHDWVPDVLSFALHDPGDPPVGDIYVGIEQAGRQAKEHRIDLNEELIRLAVHGTLHALGYDHGEEEAIRVDGDLYRRQEEVVREALQREPESEGEIDPEDPGFP
jgi:probable rRNA maturation factor